MNLLPLVGLYWRRSQQIDKLVGSGAHSDGTSHLVIDVLTAATPLLKKYWPAINEEGLLDDVVSTLKEVLSPPPAAPPHDLPSA